MSSVASASRTAQKAPETASRGRRASSQSLGAVARPPLVHVQQTVGNQATLRLVQSGLLQAKLAISQPGDPYEQEADHVAAQVMRMPQPKVQRACACGGVCPRCQATAPDQGQPTVQLKQSPAQDAGKITAPPTVHEVLHSPGQPLDAATRAFFEPRFGHDFSRVRVHTDAKAAESARSVKALAYTVGHDVVFETGQYVPWTGEGRRLLAHELTHTIQQIGVPLHRMCRKRGLPEARVSRRVGPMLQGSFWGDLWEGIKSVGSAIGAGLSAAGRWVGERVRDVAMWALNLVRDLPRRLIRLGQTLVEGFWGILTFIPGAIRALASGGLKGLGSFLWERAKRGGAWILTLLSRIFDALGGPEIVEFIMHLITRARPLTTPERAAAGQVLGPSAIRYGDVRVAESGILTLVFHFNEGRAFATFHTINLPSEGGHGRSNLGIVVHELTHVYQYEKAGSLYLGQAIHAQATIGYGYGGSAGLQADRAAGKHFRDYNREQQAQIAQDYYMLRQRGEDTSAYQPFIAELQAGEL